MISVKYLDGSRRSFKSLRNADLEGVDLRGADLRYADLEGADLRGADLRYADLEGAKGVIIFQIERHRAIYFKCDEVYYLNIGCKSFTLKYWLKYFENIGKNADYRKNEIEAYGAFIKLCSMYEL